MAYTDTRDQALVPLTSAILAADDLSVAAGVRGEYACVKRIKIRRLKVTVSVATVGATVLEFNRRPTLASAAGEVQIGELTIPAASAAGTTVYKDITPVVLSVGEGLAIEVTTAATSGSGLFSVEADPDFEQPANESNMVASA